MVKKRPTKEEHYTVIFDYDKEGRLDPSALITLLNKRIQKPLSFLIMKENSIIYVTIVRCTL